MHQMHVFEDRFPMHGAVCPIEISIVQNDKHRNTDPEVKLTVFADVAINSTPAGFYHVQREHADDGKHHDRTQ